MPTSYFEQGWSFARQCPEVDNVIQAMKFTSGLPTVFACDSWADGFIAYKKMLRDRELGIKTKYPSLSDRVRKRGK